jgi:trehalose 6-phosphate phosphatase
VPGGVDDERWAPWRHQPGRAGVLTDFDGTLAPIVPDPASATALPGARPTLARLAGRYALVAVISGRPVGYLVEQLGGVPRLVLVGLYGFERLADGVVAEHPEVRRWRPVVARVAEEADRAAPPGVLVERKGLSVTLHWRSAPAEGPGVAEWAARAAAASGLRADPGRRSVELRPPGAGDKGTVLAELADGLGAACFFGDDAGDLAAFAALRRLSERGVHTVSVAVDSDEAPAELLAGADVVVPGPPGVLELLEALAAGS